MSVVKIYTVKYLLPSEALVAAASPKAAVDVFLARRDTPKGVVIQGAYWAHGQVPEAFGGAPRTTGGGMMSDPLKGIGALAICIIIGWLTIGFGVAVIWAINVLLKAMLP